MSFHNDTYDATAPLKNCEFKHLNRKVGVTVSKPREHAGLKGEAVEVCFEKVSLNTVSAGKSVLTAEWEGEAIRQLGFVLDSLDQQIAELQAHRDRLHREREALAQKVVDNKAVAQ